MFPLVRGINIVLWMRLGMHTYLHLRRFDHQFLYSGTDLPRFWEVFIFFPFNDTLPGCDHDIILRLIPGSKNLTRDVTFREDCLCSQFPEGLSKIHFLSLLYLPIDNDSHRHCLIPPILNILTFHESEAGLRRGLSYHFLGKTHYHLESHKLRLPSGPNSS